jgi:pimeloyl-ACP methyl ester carboxylesterase
LLLHGFGANKDNWTRFSKHLTPHYRVIAPDLPGFGESTRDAAASYTISVQADRIHAFANALKLKTFHLGGNSMGGNIAGVYAARYRKNVISLCLIAPGGVISAEPSEMYQRLNEDKPNPLVVEKSEEYDELLDFVFTKRPFIPGPIKDYLTEEAIRNRPLNTVIFQHIQEFKKTSALESLLNGFNAPTLIVWGKQDRVLHFSGAKILGSIMPDAQVEVIENVGHLPMLERPEETADIYLRFLNRPHD